MSESNADLCDRKVPSDISPSSLAISPPTSKYFVKRKAKYGLVFCVYPGQADCVAELEPTRESPCKSQGKFVNPVCHQQSSKICENLHR
ncbi:hypothetical protein PoB_007294700 [Plakobranchus ocellatus]|uniref:Uncharacterized protein n=1 Tax=Plakobranchus ocellatus TaxID=259542 RepID=A0AAV4DQ33_9GAST|nr:hypothetical protein PoB_007294700 [Plakobranchus ocellatus]